MTASPPVPVVSLRAVEDGDLPLFFEWQSDEESYRMAVVPTRDAESFAAHWARNRSNPENFSADDRGGRSGGRQRAELDG